MYDLVRIYLCTVMLSHTMPHISEPDIQNFNDLFQGDPRLKQMLGFFFFLWCWVLNSGPQACNEVLCHLSHASSPYYFSYFSNRVLRLLPWLPLDRGPPICDSQVVELQVCAQLVLGDRVL
jgi:hypothetical protein